MNAPESPPTVCHEPALRPYRSQRGNLWTKVKRDDPEYVRYLAWHNFAIRAMSNLAAAPTEQNVRDGVDVLLHVFRAHDPQLAAVRREIVAALGNIAVRTHELYARDLAAVTLAAQTAAVAQPAPPPPQYP